MPRIPRGTLDGHVFHVLNRGNGRSRVFRKDGDYAAFLNLLSEAKGRVPISLFSFCMMPNHFHAVLQPRQPHQLSAFMQWWLTSHVRRYHRHYKSSGHVWQGRFKSFPIQQDEHFLTVMRYVLLNPVRAGLVARAGDWPWSSVHYPVLLDASPVPAPRGWDNMLALPITEAELDGLRTSVTRQAPFGDPQWQHRVAKSAGLESTLRPRGRPAAKK
jgi:putative transposase